MALKSEVMCFQFEVEKDCVEELSVHPLCFPLILNSFDVGQISSIIVCMRLPLFGYICNNWRRNLEGVLVCLPIPHKQVFQMQGTGNTETPVLNKCHRHDCLEN